MEKLKKRMLDAGKAPRTIQYVFATFRQVWNHARINDLVSGDSPTRKVKVPKFDNKRLRALTRDEADALLTDLQKRSEQLYHIALLSLHTGMRAGEIFSLAWGDVDLQNDSLTIRDGKSGKTRYAYLTNETRKMFKYLKFNQLHDDLVFIDRKGSKVINVSKSFDRAIDHLNLNEGVTDPRQRFSFHSLRHTFASWHVQNGTDLYTLKELLGHSTIQLTERYSHLRPEGLKRAAQNFDMQISQKEEKSKVVNFSS